MVNILKFLLHISPVFSNYSETLSHSFIWTWSQLLKAQSPTLSEYLCWSHGKECCFISFSKISMHFFKKIKNINNCAHLIILYINRVCKYYFPLGHDWIIVFRTFSFHSVSGACIGFPTQDEKLVLGLYKQAVVDFRDINHHGTHKTALLCHTEPEEMIHGDSHSSTLVFSLLSPPPSLWRQFWLPPKKKKKTSANARFSNANGVLLISGNTHLSGWSSGHIPTGISAGISVAVL